MEKLSPLANTSRGCPSKQNASRDREPSTFRLAPTPLPRYKYRTMKRVVISLLISCAAGCSLFSDSSQKLRDADELTRQGKYDEAIEAYREHMTSRLEVSDRSEWENPYFYLLTIGDVELGRGDTEKALQTYEEAEKNGVGTPLISDRYRAVASYFEEHGELQKALDVLSKYRDRDPLLFDAMLDRIAKELTRKESETIAPTPTAKS